MTRNINATQRNEIEASQGSKAPGLIYVLVSSLALVLIAFGIVWLSQGR